MTRQADLFAVLAILALLAVAGLGMGMTLSAVSGLQGEVLHGARVVIVERSLGNATSLMAGAATLAICASVICVARRLAPLLVFLVLGAVVATSLATSGYASSYLSAHGYARCRPMDGNRLTMHGFATVPAWAKAGSCRGQAAPPAGR